MRLLRLAHRARRVWWRVAKPTTRGAYAIVVDPESRVCVVRLNYGAPGLYLPGGGVRRRETPAVAIRRELSEELGIDADIGRILGTYGSRRGGKRDTITVFVVDSWQRSREGVSREIAEVAWVDAVRLHDEVSPATRRRVAEWRAGAAPAETW